MSKLKRMYSSLVPAENMREFHVYLNTINIARAKSICVALIFFEAILITVSYIFKGNRFLTEPTYYYFYMHLILVLLSVTFYIVYMRLSRDVAKNSGVIWGVWTVFAAFLLCWCAGISLFDQWSGGRIIVYTVALLGVAVIPVFEPFTVVLIYLMVHASFCLLLPYFQSGTVLWGNYLNSTAFLILSMSISYMRYRTHAEHFMSKKLISQMNDELRLINKELDGTNRKLEKLSETDCLTGILNRYGFEKRTALEWERCKAQSIPLALIIVDIDFFKEINDHYGHHAGDEYIRLIAAEFSRYVDGTGGIVARYGGDEFVLLLIDKSEDEAAEFAERLRVYIEKLAIPHMHSSVSDYVTVSMGLSSMIPSDELSSERFFIKADNALYRAKREHNNIVIDCQGAPE